MSAKCFDKLAMINRVWSESNTTGSQRFLLVALASFAWKGDTVYPSQAVLAKMLKTSERNIRNLLAGLKDSGELRVVKRGDGRGHYTTYQLFPSSGAEPIEAEVEVLKAEVQRHKRRDERRNPASSFISGKPCPKQKKIESGKIEEKNTSPYRTVGRGAASKDAVRSVRFFIKSGVVTSEQIMALEGNLEVAQEYLTHEENKKAEALLSRFKI